MNNEQLIISGRKNIRSLKINNQIIKSSPLQLKVYSKKKKTENIDYFLSFIFFFQDI